jgi:hypothetical protein
MEILCKCKAFVFTCGQNFYTYTYIIVIYIYRKFFNSHLGHACLVLRACRSATFLDHNAKKGCEFKIFVYIYIYIYIYIPLTRDLCKYLSDAFTCPCVNVLEHVAIYQYNKRCPYLSNDFTGF